MLVKSILLGTSILSLSGFASDLTASGARASTPESLTVMFYAKVYALPSGDSPMLGVTEDGSRLAVYQRRGEWTQIGFRHTTGWIHEKRSPTTAQTAAYPPSATVATPRNPVLIEIGNPSAGAQPVVPRFSKSIMITAACGAMMLGILILAVGVQSNRKRNHRQATAMVEQIASNVETKTCALEGRILPNGLSEILQLLETGRRTGMLSIEEELPSGIINFHFGQITFAQTRRRNGKEAVMEILFMTSGAFRFFEDKRVVAVNCRLSPLDVLMQHAQRVDEYQHRTLRTAS